MEEEIQTALGESNNRLVATEDRLAEADRVVAAANGTIEALTVQLQQLSARVATAQKEIERLKTSSAGRGLGSGVHTRLLDKPKEFGGSEER